MTVEELRRRLDEFPDHMEVQLCIPIVGFKFDRHTIDRVDRGQEGPEHFVGLWG